MTSRYQKPPELYDGLRLHQNENTGGCSPRVIDALRTLTTRDLAFYPDYAAVNAACAKFLGVGEDRLLLTNGLDEGLLAASIAYLQRARGDGGDAPEAIPEAIIVEPAFGMYADCVGAVGGRVVPVAPLPDFAFPLDDTIAAITPQTRLVYLANPCNPTGSTLAPHALEAFVRQLPGHVVALIDEAYLQYADEDRRPALAALADQCAARLILLRTFSKFFGLAGLRVGHAVASPETVALLARAEIPFAVSAPAVVAAEAALADASFRQHVFETNRHGRRQLLDGLAALGVTLSVDDFGTVLFQAPIAQKTIRDELLRHGLVLPQVHPLLQGCAMLAVGRPEHNTQILDYLGRL